MNYSTMTAAELRTELKNQQIAGRSAAKTKEQMITLLTENGIVEIEHKPSFNSAFDFSNLDTSTPQLSDEEIELKSYEEEEYIDPEENLPFDPLEAIEYCIQVALANQAYAEAQVARLNAEIDKVDEAIIEAAFANNQPPVLTPEQLEEYIEIEDNGYVFTHPFNYDNVPLKVYPVKKTKVRSWDLILNYI